MHACMLLPCILQIKAKYFLAADLDKTVPRMRSRGEGPHGPSTPLQPDWQPEPLRLGLTTTTSIPKHFLKLLLLTLAPPKTANNGCLWPLAVVDPRVLDHGGLGSVSVRDML